MELQALVEDTLQKTGVLGKVKAQLRSAVFNVMQDMDNPIRTSSANKQLLTTEEEKGVMALTIIRDFLDFFELDCTAAVLEPELSVPGFKASEKAGSLPFLTKDPKKPLLFQLLDAYTGSAQRKSTSDNDIEGQAAEKASPEHLPLRSVVDQHTDTRQSESEYITTDLTLSSSNSVENFAFDHIEPV
ncbi:FGFR1 oncoprotein partner [Dinochytrium kinnereticum]|nr:FGFR1 oncoprotein partner [Dinochytrium kinnereticum]